MFVSFSDGSHDCSIVESLKSVAPSYAGYLMKRSNSPVAAAATSSPRNYNYNNGNNNESVSPATYSPPLFPLDHDHISITSANLSEMEQPLDHHRHDDAIDDEDVEESDNKYNDHEYSDDDHQSYSSIGITKNFARENQALQSPPLQQQTVEVSLVPDATTTTPPTATTEVSVEFLTSFLFGIQWPIAAATAAPQQDTSDTPPATLQPQWHTSSSLDFIHLSARTSTRSNPIKVNRTFKAENVTDDNEPSQSSTNSDKTDNNISQPRHQNRHSKTTASAGTMRKPADWIDPNDGHIWRAKYCVLVGKALFFYKDKKQADSAGAIADRLDQIQSEEVDPLRSSPETGKDRGSTDLSRSPRAVPRATLSLGLHQQQQQISQRHHVWEKRVALECVGAVRSVEQKYGKHSFALLACSENDDVGDDDNEKAIDMLILRARNGDDLNEWLFQFRLCIASFVMEIVDHIVAAGDLHHPAFRFPQHQQDDGLRDKRSVTSRSDRDSLTTPPGSPVRSSSVDGRVKLAASMSPRYHRMMNSSLTNAIPQSLETGSRSFLRRRRMLEEQQSSKHLDSNQKNSRHSSLQLPFNVSDQRLRYNSRIVTPPQPRTSPNGATTTGTHATVFAMDSPPELCSAPSEYPEMERPPPHVPSKYVPPHKRGERTATNGTGSVTSKYIPPHLRKSALVKSVEMHDAACDDPVAGPNDLFVTRQTRKSHNIGNGDGNSSPLLPVSFADSIAKAVVSDRCEEIYKHLKLGGCADPAHVSGSIFDDRFIPRDASRLGKVRSLPFGYDSTLEPSDSAENRLRWEVGAFSECGIRDYNEDSYLVSSDVSKAFGVVDPERSDEATIWDHCTDMHPPGLFAIFDGHCGDHASRFAAERIAQVIFDQSLQSIGSLDRTFDKNGSQTGMAWVERVLEEVIYRLDEEFCNLCVHGGRDWESGSTALVAALVNEHLIIANLGDARGIVGRSVVEGHDVVGWNELVMENDHSGRTCVWKAVTDVHSPIGDAEHARIIKANGWVVTETDVQVEQFKRLALALHDNDVLDIYRRCFAGRYNNQASPSLSLSPNDCSIRKFQTGRVCGVFSVSRALGDRDFKAAPYMSSNSQSNSSIANDCHWDSSHLGGLIYPEGHSQCFVGDIISNKPDFHRALRVGESGVSDEFLLLACDGLWDVMDADDAYRITRDLLFDKQWPAKKTAGRLAELAVHLGSSDNITVIIVKFLQRNFGKS